MNKARPQLYLSKSRTLLAFCFCFIGGVGVFSYFVCSRVEWFLYVAALLIIFLVIFYWKNPARRFLLLCCFLFLAGGWRFAVTLPQSKNHISNLNGFYRALTGEVVEILNADVEKTQYILKARKCNLDSLDCGKITGKFLAALPSYYVYNIGDKLKMTCFLRAPENSAASSFNYKNYLAKSGVWSVCVKPKDLELIGKAEGFLNIFIYKFDTFRQTIQAQINKLYVMPEAALAAGLLYGARVDFPAEIKESFNRVGLTHIVAVSGYNISIIGAVLLQLLIRLGINRKRAFWLITFSILIFVLFVGASASVVRAGVMGIIVLLSARLGRLSRIGNILAFTAALMLLLNPYVLIWDAGFQLSFAATIGLIYFAPILEHKFSALDISGRYSFIFSWLTTLLIPTLSAIIFTLPLTLFLFGRFSLISPLVNVLILWIIPIVMLFGFLSLAVSFIFFPLGQVLAWINWLGLKYVITVAQSFGKLKFAAIEFNLSWWLMLVFYCLLVYCIFHNNYKSYGAKD